MIDYSKNLKIIKKVLLKNAFTILQLLIIFFTYIIIKSDVLVPWDMSFRWKIMDLRCDSIKKTSNFDMNNRKIVFVWIDERFFSQESVSYQWLHRWYYAEVFENIMKDSPFVMWVDVFFQRKYSFTWDQFDKRIKLLNQIFGTYDKALWASLNNSSVLAGIFDFSTKTISYPDDIFLANEPKLGHVHSVDYYKTINLWVNKYVEDPQTKKKLYPLALEVYNNYYTSQQNSLYSWLNLQFAYDTTDLGNALSVKLAKKKFEIPISLSSNNDFLFIPLYVTKSSDLHNYISFYDVYKWNYPKDYFKDKIVYIGSVDQALNDNKNTLAGIIPWVFMHINFTLSIMNNDFLYLLSNQESRIVAYCFLLINFLMLLIYKNNLKSHLAIFYLLIIEIFMVILGSIFLASLWTTNLQFMWFGSHYSIFVPVWTLLFTISLQILITWIYFLISTFSSKKIFQKLVNLYVWTQVWERKSDSMDDDVLTKKMAEQKKVAIFFSDIASFTNISEKLTPDENISFLNEYLEKMSDVIATTWWQIDKYIWDAIMSFWSTDYSCDLAAKAAIWNIQSLWEVNATLKSKIKLFENESNVINIRIWLHYGDVIMGDIGSKHKLNYTIIWDNVNLGSRLEWINKFYSTNICISSTFWDNIDEKHEFLVRKLDKITVKWKEQAIIIYELFPFFVKKLSQQDLQMYKDFISKFEEWLEAYFVWQFDYALRYFNEALDIKFDPTTNIFIERCNFLLSQKLSNWDWIRKFHEK